jgi:glycyl-tRNA synthetase beta chain
MNQTGELLIELGSAEIPAIILPKLVKQLADNLSKQLKEKNIRFDTIETLYTPRRIAFIIKEIAKFIPAKTIERKGPALKIAYDDKNMPTKACIGFARSVNAKVEDLHRGTKYVSFFEEIPEQSTINILPEIIQQSCIKIPTIKGMRWGSLTDEFIRPVYWILAILDQEIIETKIFSLKSSNITNGHRVHGKEKIQIKDSRDYIEKLQNNYVIVNSSKRKEIIKLGIQKIEKETDSICPENPDLLEEVNNLVEYPVVLQGKFDSSFLELPKEVLDTTIIHHQKCFPLVDKQGLAYPGFIIVSNIKSQDEKIVVEGNQKVMHARLSDAQFFYKTDISRKLEYYLNSLKKIKMHNKLGSIYEQSERISELIQHIVKPEHRTQAKIAGLLSKFDLATDMVGEFPELQGIIGSHYAKLYKQPEEIVIAVKEQYMPTSVNKDMPSSELGSALALSYRIDHLVGYFGVGIRPKGDHDPFGLRRSALYIVKIIISNQLSLELEKVIEQAFQNYQVRLTNNKEEVLLYILDRVKSYFIDQGFENSVVDAAISLRLDNILEIEQRIKELKNFLENDFAKDLARSNKRVKKILLKANVELTGNIDSKLLVEEPEKQLYNEIERIDVSVKQLVQAQKFKEALMLSAKLKKGIDNFFDNTLVMVDDKLLKQNRMNILFKLQEIFTRVADLSKIAVGDHNV